jgi:hypothetical protein
MGIFDSLFGKRKKGEDGSMLNNLSGSKMELETKKTIMKLSGGFNFN